MKANVELVVATDQNYVIGCGKIIPWRCSADMRWFRQLTADKVCVMGRRTWESLPRSIKPHGRTWVVLSHYDVPKQKQISDLRQFLRDNADQNVCIIGGASVYEQAMPYVDVIWHTMLGLRVDCPDAVRFDVYDAARKQGLNDVTRFYSGMCDDGTAMSIWRYEQFAGAL
jgi:dihydrofolate reductase